jgi:transcription initiation factor IIE alpha subunit
MQLTKYHDKTLYRITKLIRSERSAVKILAATKDEALSAEEIVEKSGVSAISCHRVLRKLRELGLIRLVRSTVSDETTESNIFLYKAQMDPDLIRFENGRFKLRFPENLKVSEDEVVDVRALFKTPSKK